LGSLKSLKILALLLCRKAKVLEEKYRTEEAIGILRRVTRLYPNNKPAQVRHVPRFSRILFFLFFLLLKFWFGDSCPSFYLFCLS
jgi:hypothetical protein